MYHHNYVTLSSNCATYFLSHANCHPLGFLNIKYASEKNFCSKILQMKSFRSRMQSVSIFLFFWDVGNLQVLSITYRQVMQNRMHCQSITQHTLIVKRVLSSSIGLYSGVQECCDTYLFADDQGYSHTYISESLIIHVLIFRVRMMTRVCACFLVVDIHCIHACTCMPFFVYLMLLYCITYTHISVTYDSPTISEFVFQFSHVIAYMRLHVRSYDIAYIASHIMILIKFADYARSNFRIIARTVARIITFMFVDVSARGGLLKEVSKRI